MVLASDTFKLELTSRKLFSKAKVNGNFGVINVDIQLLILLCRISNSKCIICIQGVFTDTTPQLLGNRRNNLLYQQLDGPLKVKVIDENPVLII